MKNIEAKVLGKTVSYSEHYDPSILVAVPRKWNRTDYNINDSDLPFVGFDTWNAYEFSFLTQKGLPVAAVLKMVVPCDSPSLVESKSLKLYLNSFNMERFGNNVTSGLSEVLSIIKNDINELLKTGIELSVLSSEENEENDFTGYAILENTEAVQEMEFYSYKEDPSLISFSTENEPISINVCSHLLRSNCKVTYQPDWGSVFIHITSQQKIDYPSLLAYIISFRNENHFHEEICEMMYKRLNDILKPTELAVTCIYTRRGGIDICPSRASSPDLLPKALGHVKQRNKKLIRQ